jgi:hypothetical protein
LLRAYPSASRTPAATVATIDVQINTASAVIQPTMSTIADPAISRTEAPINAVTKIA